MIAAALRRDFAPVPGCNGRPAHGRVDALSRSVSHGVRRLGALVNSVHNPAYDAGMEARFRVAARHSRVVRVLRIAVPAAVGVAMAVLLYVSYDVRVAVNTGNLTGNVVISGRKITMETPHLTGFTPDQRPYDLVAKTAVQDLTDPDHVELNI